MTKDKKDEKKQATEFKTISQVLHYVQMNLKAPKNQYSKFGNYHYRSCEDILDGLKQVLPENAYVTLSDDIADIGGTVYVKATASLCFGENCISNTAYAREVKEKAKFDASQLTGSASSYARKYALNGLFLIDDVKDADATKDAETEKPAPKQQPKQDQPKPEPQKQDDPLKAKTAQIAKQLSESTTPETLQYVWDGFTKNGDLGKIKDASPDKAYPYLQEIYANKMAELSQAPMEG